MHHGKQGNLSDDAVRAAQETIERVQNFERRMNGQTGDAKLEETKARVASFLEAFDKALDDNLNVSAALGALHDFMTDINRFEPGNEGAKAAIEAIGHADEALGIIPPAEDTMAGVDPAEIEALIEQRKIARKERRFADADAIRNELKERGVLLEDGPQGTTWRIV